MLPSCGLLGRKLGHSWSPLIHSMLFDYDYALCEKEPEELETFLRDTELAGLNVTIPYKKTVMPLCVGVSDRAGRIGSVNTLVRRADGWHGYNTDYTGFGYMVGRSGAEIAGREVVVFGTGGASLAVTAALEDMGAKSVTCISRTGEDNYSSLARHAGAQIIVNATPAGMYPDNGGKAAPLDAFPKLEAVFDLVYNPLKTALLLEAEERGLICSNGLSMLVSQAAASAELFAGRSVEPERIEIITKTLEERMRNIVLIGMPGCGKTTVGRELARLTGREMIDADAYLEEKCSTAIPDIFAKHGEEGFRKMETAVLAELGKKGGVIIAAGGGCVTRPENFCNLKQNSVIIWLIRGLGALSAEGRPLSQSVGVEKLWAERREKYAALADIAVENSSPPEQTARSIMEALS